MMWTKAFMGRQVSDDVVRSSDTTEEVQVETSDISNKFKFFESYKEPEKQRKQFRITPPRDGQVKVRGFLARVRIDWPCPLIEIFFPLLPSLIFSNQAWWCFFFFYSHTNLYVDV